MRLGALQLILQVFLQIVEPLPLLLKFVSLTESIQGKNIPDLEKEKKIF